MVGPGHHDHGWLRRHGSQDLPRHVRRHTLCPRRRVDGCPTRSGHRVQLRHVLLAHAGARQAAQETQARRQRRPAADQPAGRAAGQAGRRRPWQGKNGPKDG